MSLIEMIRYILDNKIAMLMPGYNLLNTDKTCFKKSNFPFLNRMNNEYFVK